MPFGLRVLGARVLSYWSRNVDHLLIGVFLGASELGLYEAAYSIFLFPILTGWRRSAGSP